MTALELAPKVTREISIRSISKERLITNIGKVSTETMQKIEASKLEVTAEGIKLAVPELKKRGFSFTKLESYDNGYFSTVSGR